MFKKIKNKIAIFSLALAIALTTISSFLPGKIAQAAEDPNIVHAIASSTAYQNDNVGQIITYVIGSILISFSIVITILLLGFGLARIKRIFGGGRRRGRR